MEQVQKFPGMLTALDPCYCALLLSELWFLVCLFEILSPALCPLQEGRWIVTSTKHDFCAQQLQMMSDWTELIDTMMNPASLHLGFRVLDFFSNPLWQSTWSTHDRLYQAHGYYDELSIIGFRVLGFGPFFSNPLQDFYTLQSKFSLPNFWRKFELLLNRALRSCKESYKFCASTMLNMMGSCWKILPPIAHWLLVQQRHDPYPLRSYVQEEISLPFSSLKFGPIRSEIYTSVLTCECNHNYVLL
jgi:hypothetical protein